MTDLRAPPRPRTTCSILHGSPDAPGREPAARMFNRGYGADPTLNFPSDR